jgi:hypothetical protein
MQYSSKKGKIVITKVVSIVLLLAFAVLAFGIFAQAKASALNLDTLQEVSCFSSNTLKCSGGAFSAISSLCGLNVVEDEVGKEEVAGLIKSTWGMYLQNSCDYGSISTVTAGDNFFLTYSFTPKEDILISDLFNHMITTNNGRPVKEVKKSDYNFIEEKTERYTMCFDVNSYGIDEKKLEKGQRYYLIYYDDYTLTGYSEDKVIISSDPEFNMDYYENLLVETGVVVGTGALAAGATALIIPTAGTSVLVGGAIVAGTAEAFSIYIPDSPDYGGCLVYGPASIV